MNRLTCTLALLGVAIAAASCRTSPTDERVAEVAKGALIHRQVKAYYVIVSAHKGRVGYIKDYDVTEGGGPAYDWKYVYDSSWKELGFIDQFGTAYQYHYYNPTEAAQQNLDLRLMRLPSDSLQSNVVRMLGADPATDDVTFPEATHADIAGDTAPHMAGPGVVPAKAPAAAAAPAK